MGVVRWIANILIVAALGAFNSFMVIPVIRLFVPIPDMATGLFSLVGTIAMYVVIRLGIKHDW